MALGEEGEQADVLAGVVIVQPRAEGEAVGAQLGAEGRGVARRLAHLLAYQGEFMPEGVVDDLDGLAHAGRVDTGRPALRDLVQGDHGNDPVGLLLVRGPPRLGLDGTREDPVALLAVEDDGTGLVGEHA